MVARGSAGGVIGVFVPGFGRIFVMFAVGGSCVDRSIIAVAVCEVVSVAGFIIGASNWVGVVVSIVGFTVTMSTSLSEV